MKTNNKAVEAAQRLMGVLEKIDAIESGELVVDAEERSEIFGVLRDATNEIAGYISNHLRNFLSVYA